MQDFIPNKQLLHVLKEKNVKNLYIEWTTTRPKYNHRSQSNYEFEQNNC